MFSDGRNAIMNDRRGVNCNADDGVWNHRWNLMQSCRPGYLSPIGLLDMPSVPHEDESNYVPRLVALMNHAEEVKGLMGLDACCLDRPCNQYY